MDQQLINFKDIYFHPEEEPNTEELNSIFINANKDINYIDENIIAATNNYKDLLNNTKIKINDIKALLIAEKERLQDITMLCNEKTDQDNVISLTDTDFTGNFTYSDGVFSAKESSSISTECKVINITGNGYEGNKYVLKDDGYLEETLPTDNRNYITDNNISSY